MVEDAMGSAGFVMDRVIGIDLGTTNSCVAIFEGSAPAVIPNRGGYQTTPSIVAFADGGKRLVGHIAKRQAVTNSDNTVHGAKRLIGRRFGTPEVRKMAETVAYEVVRGPEDEARIQAGGRSYTVQEISAFILMEMKRIAEDYLGEEVRKAVITVPAYFNDAQRQATKDAGKVAGLEVIRIINEPTAAALAYGFEKKINRNIAVFDLGGGTFDISVLSVGDGVFEVLSTSGDTFLGGMDFDNRLIDHLADAFHAQHGIDLREDRIALQRLKEAAENAKCDLSFKKAVDVTLPFIASKENVPIHLQQEVTRTLLESLVSDLVDRTIEICRATLENAGFTPSDVDEVVMVGGQTRAPLVQRRVEDYFAKPLSKGINPDEVVALGAAIQGYALQDESVDALLLDVTPTSLGIQTAGGGYSVIIKRNTTIPVQRTVPFTTVHDAQAAVKIVVMQGESPRAGENQHLGDFMLSDIRPAPKGVPDIAVSFSIDADGIVNVTARDRDTGREQKITVTVSGGLSEDDLARMMDERREYEVAERRDEDVQRVIYGVESLHAQIMEILPAAEPSIGSDRLHSVMKSLAEAKRSVSQRDVRELVHNRGQLQQIFESLQSVREAR
ncbi:molecular chaperone DnaK [Myxococcota bacterium]|nr:molecular chaperone DnaK [Myxococcota bacterium]